MPKVVPSQIVEYIDARFPAAKKQQEKDGNPFQCDSSRQGIVSTILYLVDQLPEDLLRLTVDDLIYFLEAYHELKSAVANWNSGIPGAGGTKYKIYKMKDGSQLNPITVIRNALSKCPDQGIETTTGKLTFIRDPEFCETIRQDISYANQALANAEWKASTVLAGSVIEALLLYAIAELKKRDSKIYDKAREKVLTEVTLGKKLPDKPKGNPNSWKFYQYIHVAFVADIISENTAKECLLTKDFRNLIHQGASIRKKQQCDRGTAHLAIAGMEHVIKELS